jgi:hypothetical protein
MKKPKPRIKVLTVETEGEFRKIRQLFPSIIPIRYNEYIELRLPIEKNYVFGEKDFNIVRLNTK